MDKDLIEAWEYNVRKLSVRKCYEHLDILKSLNADKDLIDSVKRIIRAKLKKVQENLMNEYRIICDYGVDGYVYKQILNAHSMDEAETEFEVSHRLTYTPSIYDCTGESFTAWHRIFFVNGKYVLYHRVAFDV